MKIVQIVSDRLKQSDSETTGHENGSGPFGLLHRYRRAQPSPGAVSGESQTVGIDVPTAVGCRIQKPVQTEPLNPLCLDTAMANNRQIPGSTPVMAEPGCCISNTVSDQLPTRRSETGNRKPEPGTGNRKPITPTGASGMSLPCHRQRAPRRPHSTADGEGRMRLAPHGIRRMSPAAEAADQRMFR